jgi:hypothetical protein
MKKYKNYEAIYYILRGSSDSQLKKLYEAYTGIDSKSPEGMYIDWAMEVVTAMAESDGLTEDEVNEALDW